MTSQAEPTPFPVLVFEEEVRAHICGLLGKNRYLTLEMAGMDDLLEFLKGRDCAIVFIGSGTTLIYGTSLVSKVKRTCPECRLILLCEQAHRYLVKDAMDLGAYGVILEPYPEWEVLSMIRPILADLQFEKRIRAAKPKRLSARPPSVPGKDPPVRKSGPAKR